MILAIVVDYEVTPTDESLEASIQNIQLDNQIRETPYPVVIYPTNITPDTPFFKISVIKDISEKNLNFVRYFAVGLQEFDVRVDGVFLFQLLDFVQGITGLVEQKSGTDIELSDLFGKQVCNPKNSWYKKKSRASPKKKSRASPPKKKKHDTKRKHAFKKKFTCLNKQKSHDAKQQQVLKQKKKQLQHTMTRTSILVLCPRVFLFFLR